MRLIYLKEKTYRNLLTVGLVLLVCACAWVFGEPGSGEFVITAQGWQVDAELYAEITSCGRPEHGAVSLMFMVDENTNRSALATTIQLLTDNEVAATFFLTGRFAEANSEVVQGLAGRGFEIANQSYSMVSPANLSVQENIESISKSRTILQELSGQTVPLYAPPYGVLESDVLKAAQACDQTLVIAGLDSGDWGAGAAEQIISSVLGKAAPGSLVCLHPSELTNEALLTIVEELRALELKLITVSDNLA